MRENLSENEAIAKTGYVMRREELDTDFLIINEPIPFNLIDEYNTELLQYPSLYLQPTTRSFLSATFDRMETAALITVPIELISIMFSGIYLNLASASPYVSWLRFISGFYYGVESISILHWDSVKTITCIDIRGVPCLSTGAEVLQRFGYGEDNFWRNCGCLAIMYFGLHIVAFVMVVRRSNGTPVY